MEKTLKISQIPRKLFKVSYNGKIYHIDLAEELAIDENMVNTSLKKSPSNYSLLVIIRDRLIYKRDKLEKEKDAAYSKAWLYYKESSNINNEMASHKAEGNSAYKGAMERYLKAKHKADELIALCRAYENRENILRTLSANLRKQQ